MSIAGVWTVYFTDEPIRRFRDFARFAMDKNHPVQRGYRNWLLERGIYVHPHYMIRGFLTGAHTEEDVDRVVDATASFLREYATCFPARRDALSGGRQAAAGGRRPGRRPRRAHVGPLSQLHEATRTRHARCRPRARDEIATTLLLEPGSMPRRDGFGGQDPEANGHRRCMRPGPARPGRPAVHNSH